MLIQTEPGESSDQEQLQSVQQVQYNGPEANSYLLVIYVIQNTCHVAIEEILPRRMTNAFGG